MVSGCSTLVQFQSGTREKIRALHYNYFDYTKYMYCIVYANKCILVKQQCV